MKNRKLRKLMGLGLGTMLALGTITGCQGNGEERDVAEETKADGSAEGEVPTLRLISWVTSSDPKTKPTYELIEQFAQEHSSEFKLEHENILGDELKAKIKTDIASDTVPDIFIYWGSGGNSTMLLDSDVIIPFDEYLDESKEIKRD